MPFGATIRTADGLQAEGRDARPADWLRWASAPTPVRNRDLVREPGTGYFSSLVVQ
jgi:hypothetical protein